MKKKTLFGALLGLGLFGAALLIPKASEAQSTGETNDSFYCCEGVGWHCGSNCYFYPNDHDKWFWAA